MADYGKRVDGTNKGPGWLGEVRLPNGRDFMTEKSMSFDGRLMPTLTPGMHPAELNYMRETGKPSRGQQDVAYRFGMRRIMAGKSPFKEK